MAVAHTDLDVAAAHAGMVAASVHTDPDVVVAHTDLDVAAAHADMDAASVHTDPDVAVAHTDLDVAAAHADMDAASVHTDPDVVSVLAPPVLVPAWVWAPRIEDAAQAWGLSVQGLPLGCRPTPRHHLLLSGRGF